jgi:5-methylcytosine-specific restriction endonuclease McrA
MQKHTKVYLNYFQYSLEDFIGCEVCGSRAVDIHHIERRGMGGTTKTEDINNLMALCRNCHVKYGDIKHHKEFLISKHRSHIAIHQLNK